MTWLLHVTHHQFPACATKEIPICFWRMVRLYYYYYVFHIGGKGVLALGRTMVRVQRVVHK